MQVTVALLSLDSLVKLAPKVEAVEAEALSKALLVVQVAMVQLHLDF
jgi:hypothetical protein